MNLTSKLKKISLIGLVLVLISLSVPYPPATIGASKASPIDPGLEIVLASSSPSQMHSVIVFMAEEVNTTKITGKDKAEKQKKIIQQLRQKSDDTQDLIRRVLQNRRVQSQVQEFTSLWFRNAIALKATAIVIREIAKYPEVGSIVTDSSFQAPVKANAQSATTSTPVEPNLSLINAPAL